MMVNPIAGMRARPPGNSRTKYGTHLTFYRLARVEGFGRDEARCIGNSGTIDRSAGSAPCVRHLASCCSSNRSSSN